MTYQSKKRLMNINNMSYSLITGTYICKQTAMIFYRHGTQNITNVTFLGFKDKLAKRTVLWV